MSLVSLTGSSAASHSSTISSEVVATSPNNETNKTTMVPSHIKPTTPTLSSTTQPFTATTMTVVPQNMPTVTSSATSTSTEAQTKTGASNSSPKTTTVTTL